MEGGTRPSQMREARTARTSQRAQECRIQGKLRNAVVFMCNNNEHMES